MLLISKRYFFIRKEKTKFREKENKLFILLVYFLERRKNINIGIDPLMQQQNLTIRNQLTDIKTNITNM